jgi:hypothetical protein
MKCENITERDIESQKSLVNEFGEDGRILGGSWEDPGEDFGKNSGKDQGTTVELITVVFNDVKTLYIIPLSHITRCLSIHKPNTSILPFFYSLSYFRLLCSCLFFLHC